MEWSHGPRDQWKFASCFIQNWVLVANNRNRAKSNLTGITAESSYEVACKLLDKQTVRLEQTRRVDKFASMDTHQMTYSLKL